VYEKALPPQPEARINLRHFLPLAMVVFVFSLHGSALFNPFFSSDLERIVDNPVVTEAAGWQRVLGFAERDAATAPIYRPATELSYWLNARLTGVQPFGFRAVNLLLLALLGWMLAAWLQGYVHTAPAWFAGAFVVAHPITAESVNVIVGRADLLALIGVFGFAAIQQRAICREWTFARAVGCLLLATLAIASKETGLLVAPIALAQPLVRQPEMGRSVPGPRLKHWLPPVVLVSVALVAYVFARFDQIGSALSPRPIAYQLTDNPLLGTAFAERWPSAMSLTWHYFAQVFWPNTSANQTPWPLPTAGDPSVWLGALVLAVTVGLTVRLILKRSWLVTAMALVVGQLLLVGQWLVPIGPYASNRLALPFLVAAAMFGACLMERLSEASRRKRAAMLIPGGVVVLLMVISVANTHRMWSGVLPRASADVMADPENPITRYHFGMALLAHGQTDKAMGHLAFAASHEPTPGQGHIGYAGALASVGNVDSAHRHYQVVLKHHPNNAAALKRVAELCLFLGDLEHAADHLGRLPDSEMDQPDVLHLRARLAEAQGDIAQALAHYRELLEQHPQHTAGEDYQALQKKLDDQLGELVNP